MYISDSHLTSQYAIKQETHLRIGANRRQGRTELGGRLNIWRWSNLENGSGKLFHHHPISLPLSIMHGRKHFKRVGLLLLDPEKNRDLTVCDEQKSIFWLMRSTCKCIAMYIGCAAHKKYADNFMEPKAYPTTAILPPW